MIDIDFELIPKHNLASLNLVLQVINRASDHEIVLKTLIDVEIKLALG